MEIIKIVRKQEDGSYEVTFALSEDQTKFLLNFAIGVLVQNGLATVVEQEVTAALESEQQDKPIAPEKLN